MGRYYSVPRGKETMKQKVIGISGQLESGKSTIAKILQEKLEEARIVPFAKSVKDFAIKLGWDGVKDEKGRRLLQLLGTECARKCIHEDIWVHHWLENIKGINGVIIADDVRFINECEAIKKLNGTLIRVWRLETMRTATHESEKILPDSLFDYIISNNESIDHLKEKICQLTF